MRVRVAAFVALAVICTSGCQRVEDLRVLWMQADMQEARAMARRAAEGGDDGTNDLIVSGVIRSNELQVWFVAEHVVEMPLVQAV